MKVKQNITSRRLFGFLHANVSNGILNSSINEPELGVMRFYRMIFSLFVLVTAVCPLRAQQNYGSSNVGGGITYHGLKKETIEGNRGDFGISTNPSSEGVDPKEKYIVLYPMSLRKPQTGLEYYPGAHFINITFSIDTNYCRIADMRYSITNTDSSINTGWTVLPKGRWVPQGGTVTILFLDALACKDKILFIKLYNINNPESVLTQIVSTRKLEAPQLQFEGIIHQPIETKKTQADAEKNFFKKFKQIELKGRVALNADESFSASGLVIQTNNFPFFFRGYLVRNVDGERDTVDLNLNWEQVSDVQLDFWKRIGSNIALLPKSSFEAEIPPSLINGKGKYTVLITTADYTNKNSKANLLEPVFASTSFEISRPYSLTYRNVFLGAGIAAISILAYFIFLKYRQRKKLEAERQSAKEARLSLQAVQSQLNPHFIFNALSGIQNLLNKQENEKANSYLTTFSRMTRQVLNDADKEMISVSEEVSLLNNYLKMEQLRFGFRYDIQLAAGIDDKNIEVPPMLLQPLVENAVKHGVASAGTDGLIEVNFVPHASDLLIQIKDNGKGFDPKAAYTGKGLVLSRNRISLLNTIYPNSLRLDIFSHTEGTNVTVTFVNWLA